jgi:stage V sporulation protein G
MQISEVRVKLVQGRSDRLKAFCSVTFDAMFVVRDIKVIEGADGYFVAMPSRKLTDRCPKCGFKNSLRSRFCCDCGARLGETQGRIRNTSGRTKLHADVAHPINQSARSYIQGAIVTAFEQELELAKQPGYQPPSMDDFDEEYDDTHYQPAPRRREQHAPEPQPAEILDSAPAEPADNTTLAEPAVDAPAEPAADAPAEPIEKHPFGEDIPPAHEAWPTTSLEQPQPNSKPAQEPNKDTFNEGLY